MALLASSMLNWLRRDLGTILVLILLFAFLCTATWRKWADLYFDFGRELYQPWQLSQGKVLYRDLYLEYGPLSKYFNAMLFCLFGVSFTTLFVGNLVILAALVWLLYRLSVGMTERWTATVTTAIFLCLFGFAQYAVNGNFNFVAPYSHEATHGTVICFLLLFCLARCARHFDGRWLAAAGVCVGAAFLTKPEFSVAAGGMVAIFSLAVAIDRAIPTANKLRGAAALVAGAALMPLGFFAFFLCQLPLPAACSATFGAWVTFFGTTSVTAMPYFQWSAGTDAPLDNLLRALWEALAYLLGLGLLYFFCRYVVGSEFWRRYNKMVVVPRVLGCLLFGLAAYIAWELDWIDRFRSLPFGVVVVVALSVWLYQTGRATTVLDRPRFVLLMCWAIFALAMLLKMILLARIWHYGFYLAVPAVLLVVLFLVGILPATLSTSGSRLLWHGVLVLLLAGMARSGIRHTLMFSASKPYAVGSGEDRFLTFAPTDDDRTSGITTLLNACATMVPPEATLTVIPNGMMVNYLLRRETAVPAMLFDHGDQSFWQEDELVALLQKRSPDFIAVLDDFDKDGKIRQWVSAEYQPIASASVSTTWRWILMQRKAKK